MKRIIILHSYSLGDRDPYDFVRVKSFLKGLEEEGYRKDENFIIDMIDSNDLYFLKSQLDARKKDPIDLIHAVGTPNAAIATEFSHRIPIVYYGAHPEDVGKKECRRGNICGMVLTLPFTASYKNFRFVRKLLPSVRNIYVPFYQGTIFCHPEMKEKYQAYRRNNGEPGWVEADSDYIGYKALAGLCYIIGLNYHEYLYRDIAELRRMLSLIQPEESMIMPYNDSVYCSQAPRHLCTMSNELNVPLLWNNNPEATRIGALAAVAGCFEEAGTETGRMAGRVLNGETPAQIGFKVSTRSYASINLNVANDMGIDFPGNVLDYFNEILPDGIIPDTNH